MDKLSVTVLTKNEEDKIEDALTSISWADEIIIVDSGSSDATIEKLLAGTAQQLGNHPQILVFIDRLSEDGTEVFEVVDGAQILLEEYEEQNSADGYVLQDFAEYALEYADRDKVDGLDLGADDVPDLLALSFSGYLLPWDQLAFWAVTIGSEIAQSPREVTDALGITSWCDIGGFQKRLILGSNHVGYRVS